MYELIAINPQNGKLSIQIVMPDWQQGKLMVAYRFRLISDDDVTLLLSGDNQTSNIASQSLVDNYIGKMLACDISTNTLPGYQANSAVQIQIMQQNFLITHYTFSISPGSGNDRYRVDFTQKLS